MYEISIGDTGWRSPIYGYIHKRSAFYMKVQVLVYPHTNIIKNQENPSPLAF